MAQIRRILTWRHLRAEPTMYVMHYRGAKLVREGRGLAFWFVSPSTSVVEVPLESLTRDALLELVPDLASRRGFVSGAPAVVSAGRAALRAAGAKRVQTDYFIGY